ncbi:MAG: glycerol kinase GlpK [Thermomicrobiales bacterium]
MTANILVIDQGTTSTRGIVFGSAGRVVAEARRSLRQSYPSPGLVEQDPDDIWSGVSSVIREVSVGHTISAIGIANQRETTILWDRQTGRPVHNAIVWQDRRTADLCRQVVERGHGTMIQERTGLVVDPYFSASKIAWLLDNVQGLRDRAMRGEILFGTVDSYLVWRLTGGAAHLTDATNASRTMLYDIHRNIWDQELLDIWRIPMGMMPEVRDSAGDFGRVRGDILPDSPVISGAAGDQHAATVGQACFEPGTIKSTYGTGAFLLLNTGSTAVRSENQLITTIAYQLEGKPTYALEGSIFNAGTTVQWLRDELEIIKNSSDIEWLAMQASGDGELVIVPAFTGLGAPHWRTDSLAAMFGLTRDTGRAELARGALEAVVFQTFDLLKAMHADGAPDTTELRVDGGMVGNNLFSQMLADICDVDVVRPRNIETTALGAAFLAAIGAGHYRNLDEVKDYWRSDRIFSPTMAGDLRDRKIARWNDAVRKLLA